MVIYVARVSMCRSHQGEITVMYSLGPLKTSQELQVFKNAVAAVWTKIRYGEHTTIVLQEFLWLPLCFWMEFKVLI